MPDEDYYESERTHVRRALAQLAARLERNEVKAVDAIELAFRIGCECERAETMHRACRDYSRAHDARIEAYRAIERGSVPPSR